MEVCTQKLEIDFIGNSKKIQICNMLSVEKYQLHKQRGTPKQNSEIILGVFIPHPADLSTNITVCNSLQLIV